MSERTHCTMCNNPLAPGVDICYRPSCAAARRRAREGITIDVQRAVLASKVRSFLDDIFACSQNLTEARAAVRRMELAIEHFRDGLDAVERKSITKGETK